MAYTAVPFPPREGLTPPGNEQYHALEYFPGSWARHYTAFWSAPDRTIRFAAMPPEQLPYVNTQGLWAPQLTYPAGMTPYPSITPDQFPKLGKYRAPGSNDQY